jgi:ribosomal subunit interface protein
METTVTARHCDIPEALRHHAVTTIERLARAAHRAQRGQVVFNLDHQTKTVELKLTLPRGVTRIATAEAGDFRTALDRAADKLRHQLEKSNSRYARRRVAE